MRIFVLILVFFITSNAIAEIDKTPYTNDEIWERIDTFEWKYSSDEPIINDTDANAVIDLRVFPWVEYLTNREQIIQYKYWANGFEADYSKIYLNIYPSEDENNNDYITAIYDDYINSGFVDGSDWEKLDPNEELDRRWKDQQFYNKEMIANGYPPVSKIEWFIKPSFDKKTGYLYYSIKVFYENGSITYNTTLHLLGRSGYQRIVLVFDDETSNYVNSDFINKILTSFTYNEGKAYFDFKKGDEVSTTTAKDLVAAKEESEMTLFIDQNLLCFDAISPKRGSEFSEYLKGVILGTASGYNSLNYITKNNFNYDSNPDDLIKTVSNYCKENPNEPFFLSVIKTLMSN